MVCMAAGELPGWAHTSFFHLGDGWRQGLILCYKTCCQGGQHHICSLLVGQVVGAELPAKVVLSLVLLFYVSLEHDKSETCHVERDT